MDVGPAKSGADGVFEGDARPELISLSSCDSFSAILGGM